ncbi:hypothetical protein EDEG_02652 [Edhazardia aedis USNM 41457]|uniref:Uncharacterized protein n=1 Tax=Edhazardia aedis (strain USNM 41457) TaxID=1003232 RepID=J9DNI8_EDHAE|nr:hypothetical protein EDEG_02652 [Edhazardia aedis USNM 41457]|eukprot:EJW02957.1 hypothetical protein EDEG_02652 [Edhazardia aedis USNM 41457]
MHSIHVRQSFIKIDEDLTKSVYIDGLIYFISNKSLYKLNLKTETKSVIRQSIHGNFISSLENNIVVLNGNKIKIFDASGNNLSSNSLPHLPNTIQYLKNDYEGLIFFYTDKNYFNILNPDFSLEKIRLIDEENNTPIFVDPYEDNFLVLTNRGKIYMVENFFESGRIILSNVVKRMKYGDNLFENSKPKKIISNNGYIYICYTNGLEICKFKNKHLITISYIHEKNVKFDIFFNKNSVFCKSNMLCHLDGFIEAIINDDIKYFYGDVAISNDSIYYLDEILQKLNTKEKNIQLLPETNIHEKINNLFSLIKTENLTAYKNEIDNERDLLIFKHQVNEFRKNYLDKLQVILIELKSVNEKNKLMKNELADESKQVKDQIEKFNSSKNKIIEKMAYLLNKINNQIELKTYSGDIVEFKRCIENCRKKLHIIKNVNYSREILALRTQKFILQNKLNSKL